MGENDNEFLPLPYYPFSERPETIELTQEEAATAIHLAGGHMPKAASLLRVPEVRLKRLLRASPYLQRVLEEEAGLVVDRAYSKYIEALDAEDARRQEWGATKIMQSRAAMGHLFAPASASSTISASTGGSVGEVVFHWRQRVDAIDAIEGEVVDGSGEAAGD